MACEDCRACSAVAGCQYDAEEASCYSVCSSDSCYLCGNGECQATGKCKWVDWMQASRPTKEKDINKLKLFDYEFYQLGFCMKEEEKDEEEEERERKAAAADEERKMKLEKKKKEAEVAEVVSKAEKEGKKVVQEAEKKAQE